MYDRETRPRSWSSESRKKALRQNLQKKAGDDISSRPAMLVYSICMWFSKASFTVFYEHTYRIKQIDMGQCINFSVKNPKNVWKSGISQRQPNI